MSTHTLTHSHIHPHLITQGLLTETLLPSVTNFLPLIFTSVMLNIFFLWLSSPRLLVLVWRPHGLHSLTLTSQPPYSAIFFSFFSLSLSPSGFLPPGSLSALMYYISQTEYWLSVVDAANLYLWSHILSSTEKTEEGEAEHGGEGK